MPLLKLKFNKFCIGKNGLILRKKFMNSLLPLKYICE